ncbi:hypothetical protein CDAR_43541 [Caerostris darwini]|uniref:Uncharacterized protein n=1 Tax=Caerostris darwini TaxID=1538125 RepID=A0AAV4WIS3_9ARAC|nr:hypothetical protein CDAR_43541 [Caerostris darwini]
MGEVFEVRRICSSLREESVYLFPISCDGPCKSRQTVIAGQCRMCRLSVILGGGGVAQGVVQITRWRTRDPRSQIDAKKRGERNSWMHEMEG